jgi:hypothetical protein
MSSQVDQVSIMLGGLSAEQKDWLSQNPIEMQNIYDIITQDSSPEIVTQALSIINNKTVLVNLNPELNSNTDEFNYSEENYDQNLYTDYQPSDTWPTIAPVIPMSEFVGLKNPTDNCLALAREQMAKKKLQVSGWGAAGQTYQPYTEASGVNLSAAKAAVGYINESLSKGLPVLIGVDNRPGYPVGNADHSTDHFVVIVGMGTDSKGKFYRFYDSASSFGLYGADKRNKLYYNDTTGKITGKTTCPYGSALPNMHDYIVTQVRKSKPL